MSSGSATPLERDVVVVDRFGRRVHRLVLLAAVDGAVVAQPGHRDVVVRALGAVLRVRRVLRIRTLEGHDITLVERDVRMRRPNGRAHAHGVRTETRLLHGDVAHRLATGLAVLRRELNHAVDRAELLVSYWVSPLGCEGS